MIALIIKVIFRIQMIYKCVKMLYIKRISKYKNYKQTFKLNLMRKINNWNNMKFKLNNNKL